MSKTLVVHYTPRNERSNTKKLVDAFIASAKDKTEIIEKDLCEDVPEMFLRDNLMAYIMRDYAGEQSPEYDKLMASFDANTAQLAEVDVVVVAFPMYNYSVPAVVKAWLDSVVINGKSFEMGEKGFKGLLSGKGLILSTAGAALYGEGQPMQLNDHARPMMKEGLDFVGMQTEIINADGANMLSEEEYEKVLKQAREKIDTFVAQNYEN